MHYRQSIDKDHRKRGVKGYDGAKKVKGRKRHILTDTQGLLLGCYVGAADENDREGARILLHKIQDKYMTLKKMWADMGYQSKDLKSHMNKYYGIDMEVVRRPACRFWVHTDTLLEDIPVRESGFKVLPRRWVVERTLAWQK